MAQNDRIIFALDVGDMDSAKKWVHTLKDSVGWFKVGLELFTATGPDVVRLIKDQGIKCFLDLKLHDIPNTVAGAVRSTIRTGADMMTVHLSGGRAMVEAALKAAEEESRKLGIARPRIVGVSVLTSLGGVDLKEVGIERPPMEQVAYLARFAASCGTDGMVCSAEDLTHIRSSVPASLMLITPGIRPSWSGKGDQKRIATPGAAIKAGADLLVIGRPISEAPDPVEAVSRIVMEMESA
ncbi:MAG TPA: orotidine-5'-phosphate decarboxylase [Deltaproteobacteria bacterium]|nr:orotidine-5'-phosphate decarboxylase [Deltaproteobacteria bacterium]HPR54972.1 orotidine-5'-phosphate decarboxylase [Deltaproteobacteria bacterium]HXK46310.1 orotidine-5'-phosphate decarboxylase [Deltaproteobacteria bacterium]